MRTSLAFLITLASTSPFVTLVKAIFLPFNVNLGAYLKIDAPECVNGYLFTGLLSGLDFLNLFIIFPVGLLLFCTIVAHCYQCILYSF